MRNLLSLDRRLPPSSQRSIASTAYDTAWIASVPDPANPRQPRFPAALRWLLDHQLPDGSWGSPIPYQHDRIISTLSALAALMRFPQSERSHQAVRRAQRYIWQHAHTLSHDLGEPVGFELLLPALARRASQLGIQLPPNLDGYAEQRTRKLAMIPPDMLYSPRVTLIHSLEFLGDEVDRQRLLQAQGPNGSIGNSPAATAYMLHFVDDPAAVAYLQSCLDGDRGAAAPVLHPCETFDILWSAYHRFLSGERAAQLLSPGVSARLRAALNSGTGVSLSPSFPIPDADDTAVAFLLLTAAGWPVSPAALNTFEREACYVSFPFERHPSVGVNAHVLDALKWMLPEPARDTRIAKILAFLDDSRINRAYWFDKWHISPYYATTHVIAALDRLPTPYAARANQLIDESLEWVRQTQNDDGSWGFYHQATPEETAYAILALSQGRRFAGPHDQDLIRHGATYLLTQYGEPHPPLWIDKCLYTPTNIVAAVVEAGLKAAWDGLAEPPPRRRVLVA